MTSVDWILIVSVWLSVSIWQVLFGSLMVGGIGKKLVDGGWAWGRLGGWLVISLLVWWSGHLGLAINTVNGVRGAALVLSLIAIALMVKRRKVIKDRLADKKWLILIEEGLFLGGLIWLTWVRGHNSAILDLEKFMDAGFIQGYLRSPSLPAMDMWLAGEKVNYYTFGHFMGAIMVQAWGLDLAYSYNLLLGLIMGLTLSLTFSTTVNLIGVDTSGSDPSLTSSRAHPTKAGFLLGSHPKVNGPFKLRLPSFGSHPEAVFGGLVATILIGFGGNTHAIWYFVTHGNWIGYWYADATRFIYHTIHEFPAYSFVVSDLHGHVWDLPIVLMFLGLLIGWSKSLNSLGGDPSLTSSRAHPTKAGFLLGSHPEPVVWAMAMGVLFGVMAMTNTWDVLIYGMLVGITGLLLIVHSLRLGVRPLNFQGAEKVLASWLIMAIVGVIVALPFAMNFVDIGQGVRLVTLRSPLWQLAVLWSGQLTIVAIAMMVNTRIFVSLRSHLRHAKERPLNIQIQNVLVLAMAVSAVALVIIPEFVYVKDIYPEHPRANTMFKLTYQAFVMMTFLTGWTVSQLLISKSEILNKSKYLINKMQIIVVFLIVGGLMTFPYFAYRDYYSGLKTYRGLDGLAWMAKESPDDFAAILWMKKNIQGRPVILEAVGESYTQFGRFSAFTGLPTVLGWRVHEWLWRGSFDIPGQRTVEVAEVYEYPNTETSKQLLTRYGVKYIVIGKLERSTYHLDVRQIETLGKVVFKSRNTEIVHIQI